MQYSACNIVEWCICTLGMFIKLNLCLHYLPYRFLNKFIYNKKNIKLNGARKASLSTWVTGAHYGCQRSAFTGNEA